MLGWCPCNFNTSIVTEQNVNNLKALGTYHVWNFDHLRFQVAQMARSERSFGPHHVDFHAVVLLRMKTRLVGRCSVERCLPGAGEVHRVNYYERRIAIQRTW